MGWTWTVRQALRLEPTADALAALATCRLLLAVLEQPEPEARVEAEAGATTCGRRRRSAPVVAWPSGCWSG